MKQTAVEWFAQQLGITSGSMLEQAKQMEEEQKIDAVIKTKTMTAFEILQSKLTIADTFEFREKHIPEILEAMEEYASISKIETVPEFGIPELSDEEIEEAWDKHDYYEVHIIRGAKWYREQLKQRQ